MKNEEGRVRNDPKQVAFLFSCCSKGAYGNRDLILGKIPFGVVATEIEWSQSRCAVAERHQCQGFVGAGHFLGHDAVGAVGQLVDAPELGILAGKFGFGNDVVPCRGREAARGALDADFVIWSPEVATLTRGCDGPFLMRTKHVVTHPHGHLASWPRRLHLL